MAEANILQTIVAGKRVEVGTARQTLPRTELQRRIADLPPPRGFAEALRTPGEVSLIAEVKKASPSAGLIRPDFEPVAIARAYAEAGARCLSVLTDERWFQGSADYLRRIRGAVELPLLRKDFVIDEYQVVEARAWGADAVLLIVAILTPAELREFAALAAELGLAALVEVHTEAETEQALAAEARLIGINNRDLRVFRTDLETTARCRALIPAGVTVVSESGISQRAHVARLRELDVDAMLVGEALMREPDLAAKTRELVTAGRGAGL